MRSTLEREAFSRRLRDALERIGDNGSSPARLAREFNRRYPGSPVTLHAVRKWLLGDALPAQDKLRVLAAWLGVTPEWLRFGAADDATPSYTLREAPPGVDFSLARDIAALSVAQQEVIRALVRVLQTGAKKAR